MSQAIEALRESYVEQRELAEELEGQVAFFESMSVFDFMFYAFGRFLNGISAKRSSEE